MKKLIFSLTLFMSFLSLTKAESVLYVYLERPEGVPGTIVYQFKGHKSQEIQTIEIKEDYAEVIFPDDETGVEVTELDRPEYFKKDYSVYDYYFTPGFRIEFHHTVTLVDINYLINPFYYSLKEQKRVKIYHTNFSILDKNQEFVKDISSNDFQIGYGDYFLQDKTTLKTYAFNYENKSINVYQYLIDGLKVNTKVKTICQDDKCLEFSQNEGEITFNDYVYPGSYLINGQEYVLGEDPASIKENNLNIITLSDVPVLEEENKPPVEGEEEPDNPKKEEEQPKDPEPPKEDEEEKEPTIPQEPEKDTPSIDNNEEENPKEEPSIDKEQNEEQDKPEKKPENPDTFEEEVKDYYVDVPNTGHNADEIIYYLDKKYLL